MSAALTQLVAAWRSYKAASKAMIDAPHLDWPWDPVRDLVQGRGMRFAHLWHGAADEMADLIETRPAAFPEMHVRDSKGELPDTRLYVQAHKVMPRLAALLEGAAPA